MAYCIDKKSALRVYYYMMYVDGIITEDKVSSFDEIIKLTIQDEDISYIKSSIISDCINKIEEIKDRKQLYSKIYDEVNYELNQYGRYDSERYSYSSEYVKPEWFVWNLMTIAFSDEEYFDEEDKIINLVVRKVGLSKDKYNEFYMLIKCASLIEKEKKWIMTTDKTENEKKGVLSVLDTDLLAIKNQVSLVVYEEEE